jgi:hypothetical protein
MQLVAYGAQDVYLTGNPKVTFFQAVYKRHTNFAMETIEQTVNGSATSGGRVSVTVARNGDLVGDMFIEATTGENGGAANSNCWIAERIVADVELSIGGQRIDKHYQKWWRLYSELYLEDGKKANWGKMTTMAGTTAGKVYLPLIFFFNRNPGLYLPLIALQYHEVRLDIDLSSEFAALFTSSLKVWANYVYLDTEERRRFAQKGHEYLIEQVQHTGVDTVTSDGTKQVRLSYNHPVKELVWCVANTAADANVSAWNFTNDITPTLSLGATDARPHLIGVPRVDGTSGDGWTEENAGPLSTFKLILNGQDRFKEQPGKYFNQVQPYCHHSGSACPGIYSYSFALKPEEHQPTGTCNFSRIDNAQAEVTTANAATNTALNMFAVNYNVLRIQSGMGGLAFSN